MVGNLELLDIDCAILGAVRDGIGSEHSIGGQGRWESEEGDEG